MIIVLKRGIKPSERERIREFLQSKGCRIKEIKGEEETILGAVGFINFDIREVELLAGVQRVIPISKPYKLAYFDWINGNGSISPFLESFRYAYETYNPAICGIDATGTQTYLNEIALNEAGINSEAVNFGRDKYAMRNLLRRSLVMNWLLRLLKKQVSAGQLQAFLGTLLAEEDNAEGLEIPSCISKTLICLTGRRLRRPKCRYPNILCQLFRRYGVRC